LKILFIFGNGFDLHLGLKTSFQDFYRYYLPLESNLSTVNALKEFISEDLENWSDLELALGSYMEHIKSLNEFDEIFEDLLVNLSNYLSDQEISSETVIIDPSIFLDSIAYPENFLLPTEKADFNKFSENHSPDTRSINIVTFNYTKSVESILNSQAFPKTFGVNNEIDIRNLLHIHGYINERMILGVNDQDQILNEDLKNNRDIIESIVKFACIRAHGISAREDFEYTIKTANVICIFGSSLGETDKRWWKIIISRLRSDSARLIIFARQKRGNNLVAFRQQRKVRDVISQFVSHSKMDNKEFESIQKNIHVIVNSDVFKLIDKTPTLNKNG